MHTKNKSKQSLFEGFLALFILLCLILGALLVAALAGEKAHQLELKDRSNLYYLCDGSRYPATRVVPVNGGITIDYGSSRSKHCSSYEVIRLDD